MARSRHYFTITRIEGTALQLEKRTIMQVHFSKRKREDRRIFREMLCVNAARMEGAIKDVRKDKRKGRKRPLRGERVRDSIEVWQTENLKIRVVRPVVSWET